MALSAAQVHQTEAIIVDLWHQFAGVTEKSGVPSWRQQHRQRCGSDRWARGTEESACGVPGEEVHRGISVTHSAAGRRVRRWRCWRWWRRRQPRPAERWHLCTGYHLSIYLHTFCHFFPLFSSNHLSLVASCFVCSVPPPLHNITPKGDPPRHHILITVPRHHKFANVFSKILRLHHHHQLYTRSRAGARFLPYDFRLCKTSNTITHLTHCNFQGSTFWP